MNLKDKIRREILVSVGTVLILLLLRQLQGDYFCKVTRGVPFKWASGDGHIIREVLFGSIFILLIEVS